jgi:hypothetical protein
MGDHHRLSVSPDTLSNDDKVPAQPKVFRTPALQYFRTSPLCSSFEDDPPGSEASPPSALIEPEELSFVKRFRKPVDFRIIFDKLSQNFRP